MEKNAPLILLAAGGTGGHLFPAEALGVELIKRGLRVRLATDARALRYSGLFTPDNIDVVPSETVRGRSLMSLLRTAYTLGYGTLVAARLVRRLKPAAVVGFGGAMGGVVFGQLVGYLLDHGYGWQKVFALAGSCHVVAFAIICVAIPSIRSLDLPNNQPKAQPAAV